MPSGQSEMNASKSTPIWKRTSGRSGIAASARSTVSTGASVRPGQT
jgi:hypothetical protein